MIQVLNFGRLRLMKARFSISTNIHIEQYTLVRFSSTPVTSAKHFPGLLFGDHVCLKLLNISSKY